MKFLILLPILFLIPVSADDLSPVNDNIAGAKLYKMYETIRIMEADLPIVDRITKSLKRVVELSIETLNKDGPLDENERRSIQRLVQRIDMHLPEILTKVNKLNTFHRRISGDFNQAKVGINNRLKAEQDKAEKEQTGTKDPF